MEGITIKDLIDSKDKISMHLDCIKSIGYALYIASTENVDERICNLGMVIMELTDKCKKELED